MRFNLTSNGYDGVWCNHLEANVNEYKLYRNKTLRVNVVLQEITIYLNNVQNYE